MLFWKTINALVTRENYSSSISSLKLLFEKPVALFILVWEPPGQPERCGSSEETVLFIKACHCFSSHYRCMFMG